VCWCNPRPAPQGACPHLHAPCCATEQGEGTLSLCNGIRIFKIGLRYSFVCQSISTRWQRRDRFSFRFKLLSVTISPVKCLAQRHNKRTSRPTFTLSLFYAERQAVKLWILTFKVFWSDSARDSNPGLPTFNTKIYNFYCLKELEAYFSVKNMNYWLKK